MMFGIVSSKPIDWAERPIAGTQPDAHNGDSMDQGTAIFGGD
jgi:hypothetical protein